MSLKRNLLSLVVVLSLVIGMIAGCANDDDDDDDDTSPQPTTFEVRIENIETAYAFLDSGVFNTPAGASEPGPILPGDAYEFSFGAAPGHKLSFATMFVHSNDLFYAPDGAGIDLYDESDNPIEGDVTSQIDLWDAGTEENEAPGAGSNQPTSPSDPNTGPADPNSDVRLVNDAFTYPDVDEVVEVTLTYDGGGEFTARIENVSDGLVVGSHTGVPLAPGVFVVHTADNPLFENGQPDAGDGLEGLAEDGTPGDLGGALATETNVTTPASPGAWAIHVSPAILFEEGAANYGNGLEAQAEDGDPTGLAASLESDADALDTGVFNTPEGASDPGPALPGSAYVFTVTADDGDYLSFASMFGQSNDWFFAPGEMGIALFSSGTPISGDVTDQVHLWDAGSEADEFPGAGPNQAPRQSGPDTGPDDPDDSVRMVDDEYRHPAVDEIIQVTIAPVN